MPKPRRTKPPKIHILKRPEGRKTHLQMVFWIVSAVALVWASRCLAGCVSDGYTRALPDAAISPDARIDARVQDAAPNHMGGIASPCSVDADCIPSLRCIQIGYGIRSHSCQPPCSDDAGARILCEIGPKAWAR